jgi:hypothetical protein
MHADRRGDNLPLAHSCILAQTKLECPALTSIDKAGRSVYPTLFAFLGNFCPPSMVTHQDSLSACRGAVEQLVCEAERCVIP